MRNWKEHNEAVACIGAEIEQIRAEGQKARAVWQQIRRDEESLIDRYKDRVKAMSSLVAEGRFIAVTEGEQCDMGVDENAPAIASRKAVQLAAFVPQSDPEASARVFGVPGAGVVFNHGGNFFIIGGRAYPVDQFRVHGVLSESDMSWLAYFGKYVAKVAESVGA